MKVVVRDTEKGGGVNKEKHRGFEKWRANRVVRGK